MPGAVPYTSTIALNNATLPYGLQLAEKGWKRACQENPELVPGLNVVKGDVVYKAVSDAFDLPYVDVAKYLGEGTEIEVDPNLEQFSREALS